MPHPLSLVRLLVAGVIVAAAAVIAGLQLRTTTALEGLATDKLLQRVSILDALAICFPADGELSVRTHQIRPRITPFLRR